VKRIGGLLVTLCLACVVLAPQLARSAEEERSRERGWFGRNWTRSWSPHTTNNVSVKSAFKEAIAEASAASVTILSDGEPAAIGVALDRDGHIVTKASDLLGTLSYETSEGDEYPATLVGSDIAHDLAVLKTDAKGLKPAVWRTGSVPVPGSLIASVAPEDELLSVGVISSEPRKIGGSTQPEGRRGRLGVGLGDGEAGLGVTSVSRGSAAMKAGIQPGDRIVQIDGVAMRDYEHIIEVVGANPPGRTIRLAIQREDEELELSAELGKPQSRPLPQDHWGGGPFSARRSGFPTVLPHDSVIHPTECGGPLVDTDGKVVGINIARALRVTTYAIPAEVVLEVSKKLLADSQ
jgi:serine protease Do